MGVGVGPVEVGQRVGVKVCRVVGVKEVCRVVGTEVCLVICIQIDPEVGQNQRYAVEIGNPDGVKIGGPHRYR